MAPRDYAWDMDEPREAIFITEVLQDGRATNIMAMLTGSLVLATAVFSLLAAQAWARSRTAAQTSTDERISVAALDWRANGDVSVDGDGVLGFGPQGGALVVSMTPPSSQFDLRIVPSDSTVDLRRISIMMEGKQGQVLRLAFTPHRVELWVAPDSSTRRLLAWSSSSCRMETGGLMEMTVSDSELEVICSGTVRLAHPELPIGPVTGIQLQTDPGPALEAGLSIR